MDLDDFDFIDLLVEQAERDDLLAEAQLIALLQLLQAPSRQLLNVLRRYESEWRAQLHRLLNVLRDRRDQLEEAELAVMRDALLTKLTSEELEWLVVAVCSIPSEHWSVASAFDKFREYRWRVATGHRHTMAVVGDVLGSVCNAVERFPVNRASRSFDKGALRAWKLFDREAMAATDISSPEP